MLHKKNQRWRKEDLQVVSHSILYNMHVLLLNLHSNYFFVQRVLLTGLIALHDKSEGWASFCDIFLLELAFGLFEHTFLMLVIICIVAHFSFYFLQQQRKK